MKKFVKYLLRALGALVIIFIILYIIVFAYVSSHKKSIIAEFTQKIGKQINGQVTIGDVSVAVFNHFPRLSVVLKDVSILDTQFAVHQHPFFKAEKVYADVGLWNLIRKRSSLKSIGIKNAAIYIFTDSLGYTNKYLFQAKSQAPANADSVAATDLKSIDLKGLHLIMDDRQKQKLYDFFVYDMSIGFRDMGTSLLLSVDSKLLVHSLAFNTSKGSFIKEQTAEGKYTLRYEKQKKQLGFDNIDLKIGGHSFNLTGKFDLSKIQPDPRFAITVRTSDIPYQFAKSLLTAKINFGLRAISLTSPLNVNANISGHLGSGREADVYVVFNTKNTNIKTLLASMENCNFSGIFSNITSAGIAKNDSNSRVTVAGFTGSWRGLPITSSKIFVTRLPAPIVECDFRSAFPLSLLNGIMHSNSLSFAAGEATANLTYNGPVMLTTSRSSYLNGSIHIQDGSLIYNPRDIGLKEVTGDIVFRNTDIYVQNISCNVLNNRFRMNATAKNILTLVNTDPNKIVLDWQIASPSLNLAPFTALLKQRRKLVTFKEAASSLQEYANKLDAVIEKGKINLTLKAEQLLFKKFSGQNLSASMSILERSWLLNNISLRHAGGTVKLSGSLEDIKQNYHLAAFRADFDRVDVSKVFAAFSNFGQDGITSQSLNGKLTARVNASVKMDDEGNLLPAGMLGQVDFSLKEGALVNYEPVKKIQEFVFKKRDFSNIRFAELKNQLQFKDQEIIINRMEIQSTVLSMFIQGKFSMKNTTDISIQIPLRNLKKRDEDYKPENVGADSKGGMSIFLRGTPGPDGNVKFKYDMFHRLRKTGD